MVVRNQRDVDALWLKWKQSQLILDEMSQVYGFSIESIKSESRTYPLPLCRRMTALRMYRELKWGPTLIGIVLERNHSTVIHMLKKEGIKVRKREK